MAFDERLQFLLLGMVIGFVLGYLVRLVREIKEELDEVKSEIENEVIPHTRSEDGFMRVPWIANVAVLLTVGLTVWASIVSQKASNDAEDGQDRIDVAVAKLDIATDCNISITSEALRALNERSKSNVHSQAALVDVQVDFSKFFNLILHQPPFSDQKQLDAAHEYQSSLNNFVEKATRTKKKVEDNPIPTPQDLRDCIAAGKTEGEQ